MSGNQGTTSRAAADAVLLRLYVADEAPNSVEAAANLKLIQSGCPDAEAYRVEVIDVLEDPLRALEDDVLVTPTLVKVGSPPVTLVGCLRDHGRVRRALGMEPAQRSGEEEVAQAANTDIGQDLG